jgi:hypothetical protein
MIRGGRKYAFNSPKIRFCPTFLDQFALPPNYIIHNCHYTDSFLKHLVILFLSLSDSPWPMGHRRHARDLLRRPPSTPHIVVVLSPLVPPSLLLYFFFCRHLGNPRRGERGTDRGGMKRLTGRRRRSYSREPPPSTHVHKTEILLSGQTSTIRAGQAGSPPVRRPDVLAKLNQVAHLHYS